MAQKNKKNQKVSKQQLEERIKRAEERQAAAEAKKKRIELWKRIGIAAVAVILVLALSLPTMGLMVLGGGAS
ncbi:MAG: CASC3 protein CASC3 [Coriobacteriia bacterium]|nr:CASC3 protein CASC3 [Coriobacteriia bacterium]